MADITYGNLGDDATVCLDESWEQPRIGIDGKYALGNGVDSVRLKPQQFIALLAWGEKHRQALEQLAKEQDED